MGGQRLGCDELLVLFCFSSLLLSLPFVSRL